MTDGRSEDRPGWYASAELAEFDAWEEQDPDAYRWMAGPRAGGDVAPTPVQVVEFDDADLDDEVLDGEVLDGEALDALLASMRQVAGDDGDALDDLLVLEGPAPAQDGTPSSPDIAPLGPDEPDTVFDLPRLLAAGADGRALVPTYDVQCLLPAAAEADTTQVMRHRPARIARRLWQRDMDRLAG